MEALLTTALATFLAETGDRTQLLVAVLALRFRNEKQIMVGLTLATLINCVLSAYAGSALSKMISDAPLQMFQGLSWLFAGIGMFWLRRNVDQLKSWKTGAFLSAFLGILILEFGDKSQFLVLASAMTASHWSFAAFGGVAGILTASIPAILLAEKLADILPITKIRRICGIIFAVWGVYLVLGAIGIAG
jgi:Ca2+/H+ antiporter, TMEM165/GDT1 family